MNDDKELLERFRVFELLNRYVDALNHRDWATYKELWIEDSSLSMIYENETSAPVDKMTTTQTPVNVRVTGRDQIMQLVERYNNYPWLVQLPHGIVVELEGPDTAKSRHTLCVYSHALTLIGMCYDRFVKDAQGCWKLAHRDLRPTYFESAQAPGLTTRNLPDPHYRNLP